MFFSLPQVQQLKTVTFQGLNQKKKELPSAATQVISVLLKVEPAHVLARRSSSQRLVPARQRPKNQERSGGLYVLLLLLLLPGSSWYP